jgi:hypothetical protein
VNWTDQQAVELAERVGPPLTPGAPQKIIGLKPENLKYLEFDYHVISTFDRKPPRYDAEQVDALLKIAEAIEKGGSDGVRKELVAPRPAADPSKVK